MAEIVDITFIGEKLNQVLAELRKMRGEIGDVRTLSLQTVEYARRLDRNAHELKDDLELMLKSEIMGDLAISKPASSRRLTRS
jgi:hypothetical protein